MKLTDEELDILNGGKGEAMRKAMLTVVKYGGYYGAECLLPLDGPMHTVAVMGLEAFRPFFNMLHEFLDEGYKIDMPFTIDPRPLDFVNFPTTKEEREAIEKAFSAQEEFEEIHRRLGVKDDNAYSCTCYLDEQGNIPHYGANLAWSETSATIYANSVLGARTNRMAGVVDYLCALLGKVPKMGFLTDDGRKADWIVELKTTKLPHAQILGGAIGLNVLDKVPYIKGLDKFLGTELDNNTKDYLKDFGCAAASNGAVALYHIDNLTPEAVKFGESLIRSDAKVYIIDDEEIERVINAYPPKWSAPTLPKRAFIGCPHISYTQLVDFTKAFESKLAEVGRDTVVIDTIISSAPNVIDKFKKTEYYNRLMKTGVHLTSICPCMFVNCTEGPYMSNSTKLHVYAQPTFFDDASLIEFAVKGADYYA